MGREGAIRARLLLPPGQLQCPDPTRTPSLATHNPAPQGKAPRALIYGPPPHAGASLPFRLPEAALWKAGGQGCASILRLPKSLGLTGGSRQGSGFFSGPPPRAPALQAPGGLSATCLLHGEKAPGPACQGCSAPVPKNLEYGCAWALGVFSTCCWLWGLPREGMACDLQGGYRKGCGGRCPAPVFRAQLVPLALPE